MVECKWCRGRGYLHYEPGTSLIYSCPDCGGTGYIPQCDICGKEFEGEYCEDCYCVCEECGELRARAGEDINFCEDCYEELRKNK